MKHPQDSQRMIALLKHLDLKAYTFATKVGFKSKSSISHIVKGRQRISPALATRITTTYPKINYLWLMGRSKQMILGMDAAQQQINLSSSEAVKLPDDERYVHLFEKLEYLKLQNEQIIRLLLENKK